MTDPLSGIIGHSPALRHALDLATRYARIPDAVLLLGETGVGKGLVARLMHALSGRSGEFVGMSGGQLVDSLLHSQLFGHVKGAFTGAERAVAGAFERARGGTALLDELQLWPLAAQSAVLQAVDEGLMLRLGAERYMQVPCRLLFASNRPLDELESEGRLLKDLRYRIGDFTVEIPPLRERRVDVAALAYFFLDQRRLAAGAAAGIPVLFEASALHRLVTFDWPGNARQLKGAVAYAFVHAAWEAEGNGAGRIEDRHLPPYLSAGPRRMMDAATRAEVTEWALERVGGERRAAAAMLGVHPNTIDNRRKRIVATTPPS